MLKRSSLLLPTPSFLSNVEYLGSQNWMFICPYKTYGKCSCQDSDGRRLLLTCLHHLCFTAEMCTQIIIGPLLSKVDHTLERVVLLLKQRQKTNPYCFLLS